MRNSDFQYMYWCTWWVPIYESWYPNFVRFILNSSAKIHKGILIILMKRNAEKEQLAFVYFGYFTLSWFLFAHSEKFEIFAGRIYGFLKMWNILIDFTSIGIYDWLLNNIHKSEVISKQNSLFYTVLKILLILIIISYGQFSPWQ